MQKSKVKLILLLACLTTGTLGLRAQSNEELNNSAIELMDRGRYKEALPFFEKLVDAEPYNTVFRYNRAVVNYNLKNYQAALNDYLILSKEVPDESEYYFQIGNLYDELNKLDKVPYYYNRAIELDKDQFLYFFKRGTYWLKQNRFDLALADLNHALELNPRHANSLHNRAIILYKIGQVEKACEDWCQAQLLGNSLSGIHMEKNCKTYPQACLLSK